MENTTPRRRGRPPRISRDRIVAVARAMDPAAITMQAVAEELGVDRKALNYHVSDRDGLLELVALDVLNTEVSEVPLPAGIDWRQATRVMARHMRDGMVRTGALFEYVRVPATGGLTIFAATERYAEILLAAGFTEEQTGRALAFLAEFVFSSARDAIMMARRDGVHPQTAEIRRALDAAPADRFRTMRRLMTDGYGPGEAQLDFDLKIFITGLEQLLGH
ncbi:TetR/AcrR family transcriptional regulator C-terminal domain-containing protein [Actinoplanes sp. NEAU-A12]|uniref:TetR/AcrR family transcriptional regulator C-terminal domain-containing protein n=1 Tax=Actinoplanes sandaracinus TaxID=3045177 RepID=A0ABT6WS32_9ACTN|nr:TetR/AcrR family transcriptional regulator C-terminal domain-containing protein [Actinoplanes sandaracinus]MDI6102556.1 TetR/AcrR family transcriptional regulator C-terminal domain-containing protein [Actinoplanes sandaracinus]